MIPRRFVVVALVGAALVALTHFGTPPPEEEEQAGPPLPSPTAPVSPLPTGPDAAAQAVLLKALEAQGVYYVDNVRYAAGVSPELDELAAADPSIRWGRDVIIVVPARAGAGSLVVVLRAASSTGRVFCAAEVSTVRDAGTWFAARPAGGQCPPVTPGMAGWSRSRASAWG